MTVRAGLLLIAALAGCGGSDPRPAPVERPPATRAAPEEPTREEVETIRGWADTLRAGRVAAAARYFALPALVANPGPLLELDERAEVETWNAALPCGARLVDTQRGTGGDVVATFRLTERPGPGRCGTGVGALARTAFLIREGLIVRWVRLDDPPPADAQES